MKQLPDIENRTDNHPDGSRVTLASEGKFAYYFVTRAKKSHRWTPVAWARSPGDCCQASAEDIFAHCGFALGDRSVTRLIDGAEWHRLEVMYHLRDVAGKR